MCTRKEVHVHQQPVHCVTRRRGRPAAHMLLSMGCVCVCVCISLFLEGRTEGLGSHKPQPASQPVCLPACVHMLTLGLQWLPPQTATKLSATFSAWPTSPLQQHMHTHSLFVTTLLVLALTQRDELTERHTHMRAGQAPGTMHCRLYPTGYRNMLAAAWCASQQCTR